MMLGTIGHVITRVSLNNVRFTFCNAIAHSVETFGKGKPKLFSSEDNIVKQTRCRSPRV